MARVYKQPGSDKWYSDFTDPSHPKAGKDGRVRIPLDTDKDRALEELGRLIGSKNSDPSRPPKSSSYLAFKERFLRQVSTKNRVTVYQYKRAIRNMEEGAMFQIKELQQITPGLLDDLKTAWSEKKRGLYVRNRDIQSIKAMMRTAESWGLVKAQKWEAVKKDREPKGRLLWYTAREVKGLLKVCHGPWKTIALLGTLAGLRRGEMYWLSWADVDFQRKRVHVSPKPQWNPKDHERRWIPMSDDLARHLSGLERHSEWVLDDGEGRPTIGSMTIYFKRLSRRANLKGNIHTLRHTYGSHLASGGASPKAIKEVMGHSKLEMTDRYMHLAPEAQQSVVAFLPKLA